MIEDLLTQTNFKLFWKFLHLIHLHFPLLECLSDHSFLLNYSSANHQGLFRWQNHLICSLSLLIHQLFYVLEKATIFHIFFIFHLFLQFQNFVLQFINSFHFLDIYSRLNRQGQIISIFVFIILLFSLLLLFFFFFLVLLSPFSDF